jgi:hypothetical protein
MRSLCFYPMYLWGLKSLVRQSLNEIYARVVQVIMRLDAKVEGLAVCAPSMFGIELPDYAGE